MMLIN